MKTKSIDLVTGVTLQYVEQGDPSGVPVLLLHGLSDSWHSYERLLPHLPDSIRAFAITQRGHGDSGRPEVGYGTRDFTGDVVAFMDAQRLEAAVLVGHSSPGSTTARRVAIDHPDRTRALVLIGAFADMSSNPVVRELWDSVLSKMDDPVDPEFAREFQEGTLARAVPEIFLETIIQESLKVPARVWRDVVAGDLREDSAGELTRITAPTLLLWGDRDEIVSRDDQEKLSSAIENARLVVFAGTGHGVHWEEPERVATEIVGFIRGVMP